MIACKGFWAFSDIIQSSRIFVSGLRKLPYISPMGNQNLVVNRDFDFWLFRVQGDKLGQCPGIARVSANLEKADCIT
jgi:hypothetical protein